MDKKLKKKSFTGWTYYKWEEEFGYFGQAVMRNDLKVMSLPEIYKGKGTKSHWTPESGKPRKVRIIISEIK